MHDENKLIVRRFYEDIVNTGDLTNIGDFISENCVEVHDGVAHPVGIKGFSEHIVGVRKTYPDLSLAIERQIAEGEWVVTIVVMRGTHKGEWLGIAPTGKKVEIHAVNIDRVAGGRIIEHGGAANIFEPFLKIGAIKLVGK